MQSGKDRTWDDVEQVHKIALENIDSACLYLLNMEIKERVEKNKMIHPNSVLARNEILKIM